VSTVTLEQVRVLNEVGEPFHTILYFGREVQERWVGFGMEPRGEGYVAGRVAPLGAVGAAVGHATFFNFHPGLFRAALPGAWDKASPQQVLDARAEGIQAVYERVGAPTDGLAELTELALRAVDGLLFHGRPLAAANAEMPLPEQPFARAWQAMTVLREHRGDGHVALLTASGLSPVAVLVLMTGWQDALSRRFYQATRLWDDESWAAGQTELRVRGLADDEGLTSEGVAFRERLEVDTDRLAAAPYETLGLEATRRMFELLHPLSVAIGPAFPREPVVVDTFPG
jgi:hypothetical protein